MKRKSLIRITACITVLAMLVSGCGEQREVPTLIEAEADKPSFRKVERGPVGSMHIEHGQVAPEEYSHFFKKNTIVKEIYCDVGQYVNEGDTIAIADIEALEEELTSLREALQLCIDKHEVQLPVHDYNTKILNEQKQAGYYLFDQDSVYECIRQQKLEDEDNYYNEQLYEYMQEYYNRQIVETEETIREGILKAHKSGYVTYVKDTSKSSNVAANEAVVVIADYDDTYIELPEMTVRSNTYHRYEVKKAYINGEYVPVEEYNYSPQETVYAKAQNMYPCLRYKPVTPITLNVGDSIPMVFVLLDRQNVLRVGKDSVNADEEGNYVHVRKEDSTLEKRYVKLGDVDDYYDEILSGVEEGEEVLYVQDAAKPINYEEYTVELGTCIMNMQAKSAKQAETVNHAYFSPKSGKVTEVYVSNGDEVKKGDVLIEIDSGTGAANIEEAEMQIKHLTMDYEQSIKEADKRISTMKEQNLRLLTDIEMGRDVGAEESALDAIGCQRDILDYQIELEKIGKQVAELEYADNLNKLTRRAAKLKEHNDGQGKISILAESDGIVSRVYVKKGSLVEVGGDNYLLMSCTQNSGGKVELQFPDAIGTMPGLNTKVKVSVKDSDKAYEGTVVCNSNPGKAFARTDETGKVQMSFCQDPSKRNMSIIADLKEENFFNDVVLKDCQFSIDNVKVENIIVLPASVVMQEDDLSGKKKHSYVWKIENGELVKQYVVTGTGFNYGNDSNVVIFSGVEVGDVLAKEVRMAVNKSIEQ